MTSIPAGLLDACPQKNTTGATRYPQHYKSGIRNLRIMRSCSKVSRFCYGSWTYQKISVGSFSKSLLRPHHAEDWKWFSSPCSVMATGFFLVPEGRTGHKVWRNPGSFDRKVLHQLSVARRLQSNLDSSWFSIPEIGLQESPDVYRFDPHSINIHQSPQQKSPEQVKRERYQNCSGTWMREGSQTGVDEGG